MEPITDARASVLPDLVLRQFVPESGEFNHRQLYRILKTSIRDGALGPGAKLPPTREMANALGIARNTVVQVYEQLVLEGFADAGVGRGTYVRALASRLETRGSAVRRDGVEPLSRRGVELVQGARASGSQWGAFIPGVPEVRMFPVKAWNRLQNKIWSEITPMHLTYATDAGHVELREAIADHIQSTRGVVCDGDQVVVTSGAQQALHLIAQLLANDGDRVWLEDPGYWGARTIFRNAGLVLEPIPLDTEGLAPSREQQKRPPRMMFVSPSHQYPLGSHLSFGRRQELLAYAARHQVWIVEDDYDSEFRYSARPLPSLQGMDREGRVLYLGTFSKTLFPSLRIAYLVLPRELVNAFSKALNELFREGQTVQHLVLARFMREGHYTNHIRRTRALYASRRAALIEAITKRFGDRLPVLGGDAGLHLVLGLPPEADDEAIASEALTHGVIARPLSLYSLKSPPPRGLVLGYGAVSEEEIHESFGRLAKVIERMVLASRLTNR